MVDPDHLGRVLVVAGSVFALAGLVLLVVGHVPFLGQLPGDFAFRRGPVTVYVPLLSSIVVSILLTIALNLIIRR
jgi:hypothetical protein